MHLMQALRSIATGDLFVGGLSRKLRVSDLAREGGILFDNRSLVGQGTQWCDPCSTGNVGYRVWIPLR
jgi:hypothetical protein